MNDDNKLDSDDITTGNWYKYFTQVKQLCELNDITLIATTIPEVRGNYPHKDKMSEVIRNSGVRYIDVAKAVGSNAQGEWYGNGTEYDYQSTDNVHPSQYGASAIATQFLIDFPELMQY
jgi:lysophospholipase L1-like esterase